MRDQPEPDLTLRGLGPGTGLESGRVMVLPSGTQSSLSPCLLKLGLHVACFL